MEEILNIPVRVSYDKSKAHYEVHARQSYASSSFNSSDEIWIAVLHQDLCILPSESSLNIFARPVNADGTAAATSKNLVDTAIYFLFDEIRYERNGIKIDRYKSVVHNSTMKSYNA